MTNEGPAASHHLRFLGDAFHVGHARHFFFVDLESVGGGGVVHKELYRLLYERVEAAGAAPASAAVLLFRQRPAAAGNAAQGNGNAKHQQHHTGNRNTAGSGGKLREKKMTTTKRFEEKCGGCKKPIVDASNAGRKKASMAAAADDRRAWVQSATSPAHQIAFAATFLVERVLAARSRSALSPPEAVNVYLLSNDDNAAKQLARQLKGLVRLMQGVAENQRKGDAGIAQAEVAVPVDASEEDEDEEAVAWVSVHRLRVDRAGVWAKHQGAECMREAGLVSHARLTSATATDKSSKNGQWEVINPFAFLVAQPDPASGQSTDEAAAQTKEKDVDAVARRVKYHLWAEHEKGIVLPRTLYDLRKQVRQMCAVEKRLDGRAVLALLEQSRLIDVCPICHDCEYSFDLYNNARSSFKKAEVASGASADDAMTVTTHNPDAGCAPRADESDKRAVTDRKGSGKFVDRHSKAERTKRVAQAITLTLLRAKREDRPTGRRALLNYIENGHTAYKTRIDAELVMAKLIACGFVSTPPRHHGDEASDDGELQRVSADSGMALGRQDVSVEYHLDLLSSVDRERSASEHAARRNRVASEEVEQRETDGLDAWNDDESSVPLAAWAWNERGLNEPASDAKLAEQRRLIELTVGRGRRRTDKRDAPVSGTAGPYMAYLADELKVADRSVSPIHSNIDDCGLKEELLRGFYSYGFEKPTILQSKAIAAIMAKRDVLLLGTSGSGKTAAYVLPLLQSIDQNLSGGPQAIVLVPTRPLAQQVSRVIAAIGSYMNVKCALVTGGGSVHQCMQDLRGTTTIFAAVSEDAVRKQDCQVIVATAGRLIDMAQRGAAVLDQVRLFVVDEIDDMISPTKRDLLYDIFTALPSTVQVCTVDSALSREHFEIHKKFMRAPFAIATDDLRQPFPLGVDQYVLRVSVKEDKLGALVDMLRCGPDAGVDGDEQPQPAGSPTIKGIAQAVIFCKSKRKVDWLFDRLVACDISCLALHEDMEPESVQGGLMEWRTGSRRILVTTDSLSFGLDVQQTNLVINFNVPRSAAAHVRRVGRAGRFSRKGAAVTLLARGDDEALLEQLRADIPFSVSPLRSLELD